MPLISCCLQGIHQVRQGGLREVERREPFGARWCERKGKNPQYPYTHGCLWMKDEVMLSLSLYRCYLALRHML